ncbi:MAG: hypothetical protein PWP66_224 [Thermosediminibacterales bacterium]|jgi:aspartate aminotransferase-like enzyme|nr:hypothetical protein [Thermosediminibacterales bacterium]
MKKGYLRLPGPTEIPEEVLLAMSKPMIGHRGKEFKEIFSSVSEEIKGVFQTQNDVLIFPGAGTGGMEAAIVNLFSPGDKVLLISVGVFGNRFGEIAERFHLDVEKIEFQWGKTFDLQIIKERIDKDKGGKIKGVIVTHNETSTGVLNDISSLKDVLRNHSALLIVDAVSSLGAVDLKTDEWGIDVVVTGSQKALMLPPGLTLISISPKGWDAVEKSQIPKYYWDFKKAKNNLIKGQTPYTPAISLIFGLKESLKLIYKEGLDNIFSRHILLSKAFREGIKCMGLTPFADDHCASPTVTAIKVPDGIEPSKLRKKMADEFRMDIAGGQQKLQDTIIRVGHMGYVDKLDIISTLWALGMTLEELGFGADITSAIKKAQQVLKKEG